MTEGIARRSLVAEAIEEGAQAIIRNDVPLGLVPMLRAALQGAAMRSVLNARIDQVVKHGHDAEADRVWPILWIPKRVRDFAEAAYDAIGFSEADRDLDLAEKRLAQTAALCLAALDRISAARSIGGS